MNWGLFVAEGEHVSNGAIRFAPLAAPLVPKGPRSLVSLLMRHRWFTGLVIAPTLAAFLYFGLIASDVYVSEAQFVLRSAKPNKVPTVSALLQTVGLSPAKDETSIVARYMMSRDMLRILEERHEFRRIVARPGADFWQRFPRPLSGKSFERLHVAYPRFVSVVIDPTSGVATLRVRAFRGKDAQLVGEAILSSSERFVNRLNAQARTDAIRDAGVEVKEAEGRIAKAQDALTRYRLQTQILDPQSAGKETLELVARLSAEGAALRTQIDALSRSSPTNPELPVLRGRVQAVDAELSKQKARLTGDGASLANQLAQYERLFLEARFAEQALASANASMATARVEARQKEIYIQRVAAPSLADKALYPKRLRDAFTVFVSCLLAYGILWLVSAGVREHGGR